MNPTTFFKTDWLCLTTRLGVTFLRTGEAMNIFYSCAYQRKHHSVLAMLAAIAALAIFASGCSETNSNVPGSEANSAAKPFVAGQESAASATLIPASELPANGAEQVDAAAEVGDLVSQAAGGAADQDDHAGSWLTNAWQGASDSSSQITNGSLKWADKTFNRLKDQGLTTAESTGDWLTDDWRNMESWEYKIVQAKLIPNDELEAELNRLGQKGWECFSISQGQMFFKKPRESYLRRLPFKDLLRLAPLLNQGN